MIMLSIDWYVVQIVISCFVVTGINAYATDNEFGQELTEVNRQPQQQQHQPLKFGTKTTLQLTKPENDLTTAPSTIRIAATTTATIKATTATTSRRRTTTTATAASATTRTTTARSPRNSTAKTIETRRALRITPASSATSPIPSSIAAAGRSSPSRLNNLNGYPKQYDIPASRLEAKQLPNRPISKSSSEGDGRLMENRGRGSVTFKITSTTQSSDSIENFKQQQKQQRQQQQQQRQRQQQNQQQQKQQRQQQQQPKPITERIREMRATTTEKNSRELPTKLSIYPPTTSTLPINLIDKSTKNKENANRKNNSFLDDFSGVNKQSGKNNNNVNVNNNNNKNNNNNNNNNNKNKNQNKSDNKVNENLQIFEGSQPQQQLTYAATVKVNKIAETNLNELVLSSNKRQLTNNTIMRSSSSNWVNEINHNVDGQRKIKTTTAAAAATTRRKPTTTTPLPRTTKPTTTTTMKTILSNNVFVRTAPAFNLFGADFWQFLNGPLNQVFRASGTTKRPPKKYRSTLPAMRQNLDLPIQIKQEQMEIYQRQRNQTLKISMVPKTTIRPNNKPSSPVPPPKPSKVIGSVGAPRPPKAITPNNKTNNTVATSEPPKPSSTNTNSMVGPLKSISPNNKTSSTVAPSKPSKPTDGPFRIAIPTKNHLFSSDPENVKGRRDAADNLRNMFSCPRESEVRFQLFPKICEIDDDCKVWNRDELCCDIFGAKSCVSGISKPLLESSHTPILGLIPRKCPNRPLAELWWDVTECETDMDCWPRVCCPDGRKRYCRTSQPELQTIPLSVRRSFSYLSEYLECTPPPPPIFDIHPKVCTSTFDCFPNVCCQEAGLRHCRPPKKSVLTMLANVFNVDFVKRLTKNIVIK